jgi:hypothetical protein
MDGAIKYLISRTEKVISLQNETTEDFRKMNTELYAKELDFIRKDIGFIAKTHQKKAKNLMLDFIEASYSIFDRITDKNSIFEKLFQKCVEDLAGILAQNPPKTQEIADIVCHIICMYDLSFGHYFNNNAISTFKELLSQDEGLDRLKDKLTERLNKTKKKRHEFIYRIENALKEIAQCKELL